MLIIKMNATGHARRPKYHPSALWKMWSVLEVEAGKKAVHVYGPATHIECTRYIQEQEVSC